MGSTTDGKVKFWVFVSLCSLLIWIARLVPDSLGRFYNLVFVSWDYYYRAVVGGWMYSLAAIGIIARLIAVSIGLVVLFLVWRNRRSFFDFKRWVATALCLESLYYVLLIPSPIWLFALASQSRISYTFGVSYVLQIAFTAPFLAILAVKVFKQEKTADNFQVWKWGGLAFCGYTIALWSNSVLRWVDMVSAAGMAFFSEVSGFGALNAFVFMSLAVAFAVFGVFGLLKQRESAKKWWGLSLLMTGLHYTLYVVFAYFTGTLNSVWLIDIWAISFLGLGISMLIVKRKNNKLI